MQRAWLCYGSTIGVIVSAGHPLSCITAKSSAARAMGQL